MRTMIVLAVCLAFGACKKKSGDDTVAKLEGFSKAMCECKDKACADKVTADMTAWGAEMSKNAGKEEKPDPDLAKKSADIMAKYTECMTKLMTMDMAGSGAGLGVTELSPAKGDAEGGTYVLIKGSDFLASGPRNAKVYFGSRQGTIVRFASDHELVVQAPGGKPNEVEIGRAHV